MAPVHCARFLLACMLVYTFFEFGNVDAAGFYRKRQLVVGRVGFRPGRSLAIGRGALLKPSGKRSESSPVTLAPTLDDILLPSFRATYCTAERQELADVLFANVVQAMQVSFSIFLSKNVQTFSIGVASIRYHLLRIGRPDGDARAITTKTGRPLRIFYRRDLGVHVGIETGQ